MIVSGRAPGALEEPPSLLPPGHPSFVFRDNELSTGGLATGVVAFALFTSLPQRPLAGLPASTASSLSLELFSTTFNARGPPLLRPGTRSPIYCITVISTWPTLPASLQMSAQKMSLSQIPTLIL